MLAKKMSAVVGNAGTFFEELKNEVLAFPFNSDGIAAAVAKIVASRMPGRIRFAPVPYTWTADVPIRPGIHLEGIPGEFEFWGKVPDQNYTPKTGTRHYLAPGVRGFTWNAEDFTETPTNVASYFGASISIRGMAFIGGASGFKFGAKFRPSVLFCYLDNLFFENQTSGFYEIENCMHIDVGNIYCRQSIPGAGGGPFHRASLGRDSNGDFLLPGNYQFHGGIFVYISGRKARGLCIHARGGLDCQLNQVSFAAARVQINRFTDPSMTFNFTANGTGDFTLASAATLSEIDYETPVVFATAAPANFVVGDTYFITNFDPGTLKFSLSSNPQSTAKITTTSSGTFTLTTNGYANLECVGNSNTLINNVDLGRTLDLENNNGCHQIIVANTRSCKAEFNEVFPSATRTSIVLRAAFMSFTNSNNSSTIQPTFDYDANSFIAYNNKANYTRTITASETVTPRRHKGIFPVEGTVTISLPNKMFPGFDAEFPITAAGTLTFVAASGAAGTGVVVTSNTGLSSSTVGAVARVVSYKRNEYKVIWS